MKKTTMNNAIAMSAGLLALHAAGMDPQRAEEMAGAPRSVWRCDPLARKAHFDEKRSLRKERIEHGRIHGYGAWKPQPWQRAPRKYPSVMPLDLPDNLVHVFASAMGAIRPRRK